jgi:2,4'-dihydroxyacetophenone dioxygenase
MPTLTFGQTTTSGSPLPVVSVAQTKLLTINEKNLPLFKDALGPGISVKPLRLDLDGNCWVVLATFAPGIELPIHYHTGPAEVYTLQGCWLYKEYPDDPQTSGSYLYEPGGSVHTFYTPESNTEDTIIFVRVQGANVNFNEDGTFHSILDAVFIQAAATDLAKAQGVEPNYILGNEHAFTTGD